jgi:hypothetical protein
MTLCLSVYVSTLVYPARIRDAKIICAHYYVTHSGSGRTTAIGQLRCWQTGTTPPSPLNCAAAYLKLGKYVSTGTWGKHTIC